MTPGGTYPPGTYIGINCTVAGNVSLTLSDGSVIVPAVPVGFTPFPWSVTSVNTSGTTATATYYNLGGISFPNLLPNSRLNNAEATDDVEHFANWNFATDLSGHIVTQTGTSTIAWAAAQSVAITYASTSDTANIDQSFTDAIVGHTYTIRVAMNSITTMSVAIDVGTVQGGFVYASGLSVAAGAFYFTFVATSTTVWVRLRSRTAAGSASIHSISGMIGGVPPDWKLGGASTTRDLEIYLKVRAVGVDATTGYPYMRVQFSGTSGAGGTGTLSFHFNAQGAIPSLNGDFRTGSLYSRLVAGSMSGFASTLLSVFPSTGLSNLTPAISPQTQLSNTAAFTRDKTSGAFNNASTASCFLSVEFTYNASSALDITYDFMVPQVNAGPVMGPARLTP